MNRLTALFSTLGADRHTQQELPASRVPAGIVLLLVWVLSAAYAWSLLDRGWVPHDEGAFGQIAERVLAGELPHRDFDDLYTGGLSYLHALAFRLFGVNVFSLRIVLFAFFLAFVPAVYSIARRFAFPFTAGAVTLVATAWSIPNWPSPVASWYTLFFATFGIGAMLRHIDGGSRWWLFAAGVCGGASFLAKINGLYVVAGMLLFLVYRAQYLTLQTGSDIGTPRRARSAAIAAGLLVVLAGVATMVGQRSGLTEMIEFVLPIVLVVTVVLWREIRYPARTDSARRRTMTRMAAPFLAGVLAPIVIFALPYLATGSLAPLIRGVFFASARRLEYTSMAPPALDLFVVPALAIFAGAVYARARFRPLCGLLLAGILTLVLVGSRGSGWFYALAWRPLRLFLPLAIVIVGWELMKDRTGERRRQATMLVLSVTAFSSLIQFPFAAPIYVCLVAPLLLLSLLAVVSLHERSARSPLAMLLVFYFMFALYRVTPGFIYAMGWHYAPDRMTARLDLPRAGGLRVFPGEATEYERLVELVKRHARGEYIYAGPDSPEVYFLSGLRNPTRTILEFLDLTDGRETRVLREIDKRRVRVVVLQSEPEFSNPLSGEMVSALEGRFPHWERVGRFEVRWR